MYFMYPIYNHSHEVKAHHMRNDRHGKLRDEYGYYYCRGECRNVFSTKVTRNMVTTTVVVNVEMCSALKLQETGKFFSLKNSSG